MIVGVSRWVHALQVNVQIVGAPLIGLQCLHNLASSCIACIAPYRIALHCVSMTFAAGDYEWVTTRGISDRQAMGAMPTMHAGTHERVLLQCTRAVLHGRQCSQCPGPPRCACSVSIAPHCISFAAGTYEESSYIARSCGASLAIVYHCFVTTTIMALVVSLCDNGWYGNVGTHQGCPYPVIVRILLCAT